MKSASFAAACAAALVAISVAPSASAQEAQPPHQEPAASASVSTSTTTTETTTTTTTAPPPVSVAERVPFGKAGQVVLAYSHFWGWGGSDAAPGTIGGSHIYNGVFVDIHNTKLSNGGGSTFQLTVQPSADYFVIDNLSVGAFVGFAYYKNNSVMKETAVLKIESATAWQLGPRIGYNIPIGSLLSIWPKVGYSFQTLNVKGMDKAINTSEIDVSIPIMVHPAEHFFVGFGPAFATTLNNNALNNGQKPTSYGGQVSIGGWFGL